MPWGIRIWPAAADLQADDLEPGENLVASFSTSCQGVATFMTEGTIFVTDRRLLWLGDQFIAGHGPRVEIPFADIQTYRLDQARSPWKFSTLVVKLRRLKWYSFHAGSRPHVQLSELLSAFPVHTLLRGGDETGALFDAVESAMRSRARSPERLA